MKYSSKQNKPYCILTDKYHYNLSEINTHMRFLRNLIRKLYTRLKLNIRFRFQQLLEVQMENDDEDKYVNVSDDDPHANLIMEVIKNDSLRRLERVKKHESENHILTAAKLISPMIEDSFSAGYNWCVDTIKMSAQHSQLANDLEINKAVMFLRQKDFGSAIDTLKAFERQEGTKIASTASTNLSFLYLLQGLILIQFIYNKNNLTIIYIEFL